MSEVQGGNAGMNRLRLILLLSHGFESDPSSLDHFSFEKIPLAISIVAEFVGIDLLVEVPIRISPPCGETTRLCGCVHAPAIVSLQVIVTDSCFGLSRLNCKGTRYATGTNHWELRIASLFDYCGQEEIQEHQMATNNI